MTHGQMKSAEPAKEDRRENSASSVACLSASLDWRMAQFDTFAHICQEARTPGPDALYENGASQRNAQYDRTGGGSADAGLKKASKIYSDLCIRRGP